MESIANQLQELLETSLPELNALDEGEASLKPQPSKWSKKEVIGHLVDSAQNNLRRFVVAQYEHQPLIVYQQDFWVDAIRYREWGLAELILLWYLSNQQIVQVLETITDEAADKVCETGALHSLRWLAEDYIKHLKHHLHQVLEKEDMPYP